MTLPSGPAELWHYLQQRYSVEKLVPKIHLQLVSDLERAGCFVPELPEKDPLYWIPIVATTLQKLTPEQLHALLYIIDLPEKWHQQLVLADTYFEQLAEAILYRELVKVYYKLHYSGESPL